jgi:hypothetical protein
VVGSLQVLFEAGNVVPGNSFGVLTSNSWMWPWAAADVGSLTVIDSGSVWLIVRVSRVCCQESENV